jgi:hypothetical protein
VITTRRGAAVGIRIVLGLLIALGWAIAVVAQFGDSVLMATAAQLQQALNQGDLEETERLLRELWVHARFWKAILFMGLGVFALAGAGFFVIGKDRDRS